MGIRARSLVVVSLVLVALVATLSISEQPSQAGNKTEIVVVGGPAAVSDEVVDLLEACTSGVVRRIAGPNRFQTAAAVSKDTFPTPGVPAVFITRADIYPDALSGIPKATLLGGPILLVNPTGPIPSATKAELARLEPKSIYVLGGPAAVSPEIEAALAAYTTGDVSRIGGSTRYDTAALVSQSQFSPGVDVAYVARGDNFPDAMVAGVLAAISDAPVLLTRTNAIPTAIKTELGRLKPGRIEVVGGTAVVSDSILTALEAYTSGTVTRIAGANRYATAAEVSKTTFPDASVVDRIYIGRGDTFADVLPAGVAAGVTNSPLLLVSTDGVPSPTAEEILRYTGASCAGEVNRAPTAVADAYTTPEDTPFTTPSVLSNDTDPDGNALSVDSFDAASSAGGTVSTNGDGTFDYTPPLNFHGSDSFDYTVTDGSLTDSTTVTITVTPVNDTPVANDDSITVDEGGTATVLDSTEATVQANDTDAEDGVPSGNVALVSDVSNGTLTLNTDGTFSYTHDGSETTTDSFTYTVDDSAGATSNVATVAISISGDNDTPVANDDSITVDEGGTATVLDSTEATVQANDTDAEDGVPSGNVALVSDVSNGTLTLNTDGTFSYTHDGSETTTDSFTYTVDDSAGATSNVATVSITVTPVNDDPVANDDSITVDEGGTATVLDSTEATVQANDTDAEDGVPSGSVALVV